MIKVFGNNYNKLVLGDCFEYLKDIPSDEIDLIIADPPYDSDQISVGCKMDNSNYFKSELFKWNKLWLDESIRISKNKGYICVVVPKNKHKELVAYINFRLPSTKIFFWDCLYSKIRDKQNIFCETILLSAKNNIMPNDILKDCAFNQKTRFFYLLLTALFFVYKMTLGYILRRLYYKNRKIPYKKTAIPEKLAEVLINALTKKNDTVLDLFAGTFTVSMVSKRMCRKSIGVDINCGCVKEGSRTMSVT